jgi:hypothetical protein
MAGECLECNRPIMCADCDDLLRAHMIYGVHSPGLARRVALEDLVRVAEEVLDNADKLELDARSSTAFLELEGVLKKLRSLA